MTVGAGADQEIPLRLRNPAPNSPSWGGGDDIHIGEFSGKLLYLSRNLASSWLGQCLEQQIGVFPYVSTLGRQGILVFPYVSTLGRQGILVFPYVSTVGRQGIFIGVLLVPVVCSGAEARLRVCWAAVISIFGSDATTPEAKQFCFVLFLSPFSINTNRSKE